MTGKERVQRPHSERKGSDGRHRVEWSCHNQNDHNGLSKTQFADGLFFERREVFVNKAMGNQVPMLFAMLARKAFVQTIERQSEGIQ